MLRFVIKIDKSPSNLSCFFRFQNQHKDIIIQPEASVRDGVSTMIFIDVSFSAGFNEQIMALAKNHCLEAYMRDPSSNVLFIFSSELLEAADSQPIEKSSIFLNYLQDYIKKYLDITDIYSEAYLQQDRIFDSFRNFLGVKRTMVSRLFSALDDLIANDEELANVFATNRMQPPSLRRDINTRMQPMSLRRGINTRSGLFSEVDSIATPPRQQTLVLTQDERKSKDQIRAKNQEGRHKQTAAMFQQPKQTKDHQQRHKHRNTNAADKRYK